MEKKELQPCVVSARVRRAMDGWMDGWTLQVWFRLQVTLDVCTYLESTNKVRLYRRRLVLLRPFTRHLLPPPPSCGRDTWQTASRLCSIRSPS